ncbi:MAG TPA: cytosine permease, partial [Candidatus Dormibacteraeota bacterium]
RPPAASTTATIGVMTNAAMLIIAYFAALLLNFGDFARFGKDEAAMKMGNFLGLPVNFLVFSIITVIVTAGTLKVFGQAIMDPVLIVEKIGNPIVVIIGSVTFIVATMGINIVANFVSPAYDIANLCSWRINFASSEESVGGVRFRQFAKCMIQRDFRDVEGSEAVGFSHGQSGLVVEALDHAAG